MGLGLVAGVRVGFGFGVGTGLEGYEEAVVLWYGLGWYGEV